jgi:hypothetical protein
MTKRFVVAALACAFALPVFAQKEPAEVTDSEIAKYKQLAASGCRDAGEKQGDPKEKVDAFCGCLISTLEKSMKRPEWQQAYFYSVKGETDRERQVLGPHLKNVATCAPQPAAPAAQTEAPAKPELNLKLPSTKPRFNAQ